MGKTWNGEQKLSPERKQRDISDHCVLDKIKRLYK